MYGQGQVPSQSYGYGVAGQGGFAANQGESQADVELCGPRARGLPLGVQHRACLSQPDVFARWVGIALPPQALLA
jgi:hypothetical protein